VKAGILDRSVAILRSPMVDDGYGMQVGTPAIYCERKASWKAANGRTSFEHQGREAKAGGTFWLRSDTITRHIVETDNVVFEGRVWEILGVNEVGGRRDGIELTVVSTDGQAALDLSGLSPLPDAATTYSGWAAYIHNGASQPIAADTDTAMINNAGVVIESQKPADVATFYDGTTITGRSGDSIATGIEFTFTPDDGDASLLTVCIDIGGSVGKLYPEEVLIVSGASVPHKVSYHPPAYTLDTWEDNGGVVTVTVDGPGVISAVRYVIHRLHKAR